MRLALRRLELRALVSQPHPGTHLPNQIAGAEIDCRARRRRRSVLALALLEFVFSRFVLIPLPLNRTLLVPSSPGQFLLRVFALSFIQPLFPLTPLLLLLSRTF